MFMKYSIVTRIYTEILINQAVDNFTSSRFRESRVNSAYLYKIGANLYDGNRFAPVFISLHIHWFSDCVLAGSGTMGAGHPGMNGLCCVIFVLWHLSQQMLCVVIDFQLICFRSFCDAVNYGAGLCSADCVD